MNKTINLLAIGDPCADVVICATRVPLWDNKCLGVAAGLYAGGAEANVACAASRLGLVAAMFGQVGDDSRDGRRLTCRALQGPVVDTTGAGDTFAGVRAASLLCGQPEAQALHGAVVAASLSCRRTGAQSAQPTRSRIEAALLASSPTQLPSSPRN